VKGPSSNLIQKPGANRPCLLPRKEEFGGRRDRFSQQGAGMTVMERKDVLAFPPKWKKIKHNTEGMGHPLRRGEEAWVPVCEYF